MCLTGHLHYQTRATRSSFSGRYLDCLLNHFTSYDRFLSLIVVTYLLVRFLSDEAKCSVSIPVSRPYSIWNIFFLLFYLAYHDLELNRSFAPHAACTEGVIVCAPIIYDLDCCDSLCIRLGSSSQTLPCSREAISAPHLSTASFIVFLRAVSDWLE